MGRVRSILQVSTGDQAHGAEGSALQLFYEYRKRGIDSWLAVGRKTSRHPDIFEIANDTNRTTWTRLCRSIQIRLADKGHLVTSKLVGKLAWLGEPRRLLDRQLGIEDFHYPGTWGLLDLTPRRPSLLHCHILDGNYFDLRALPWLSAQVPVILDLRDAWGLTGHCCYPLRCKRWKAGCGRCPDLTIYPPVARDSTAYNWRRKKNIYARSRLYVTAPSQWMMGMASESMLVGTQFKVIKNAIDLAIYRPLPPEAARKRLELPANADVLLLTAHNQFKDLKTMETALARLSKRKEKELLFLCLGRAGLDRPLGQGRIRYLGFEQSKERLAHFYQASDVFIHASLTDNAPRAVLEAMACGTPVVATATGGIPEQIEDGVTGILVEQEDPVALAHAVETLLEDDDLKTRMGNAAAAHARKYFGVDRQVEEFLSWYEEIQDDWLSWKNNALQREVL